MLWIGLTGGIATGKSTVSRLLRERGFPVIDADTLAREAVQIGTAAHLEVTRAFGPDAILPSGELNRARIGEVVFSDRTKLLLLESIIHPQVRSLALQHRDELAKKKFKAAFYDVPLLFEKSMESMFDHVVVVAADPGTQKTRLMARNGFSSAEADKRILSQIPILEKVGKADFVIRNDSTPDGLEKEVERLLAKLQLTRPK